MMMMMMFSDEYDYETEFEWTCLTPVTFAVISVTFKFFFFFCLWGPSSAEACLFLSEMYCLGEAPMDGPDYEKAEELRSYGMALYDYYRWDS